LLSLSSLCTLPMPSESRSFLAPSRSVTALSLAAAPLLLLLIVNTAQ
jgi:hypothetical protein